MLNDNHNYELKGYVNLLHPPLVLGCQIPLKKNKITISFAKVHHRKETFIQKELQVFTT